MGVPPLWMWPSIGVILVGVVGPVVYLLMKGLEGEWSGVVAVVWRGRNAVLLWNTLALGAGVLVLSMGIALPQAWLATRAGGRGGGLRGGRWVTMLAVLPLAVPGYVTAFALLGATGRGGMLSRLLGVTVPSPSGYWGAVLALSTFSAPYLFLNLLAAYGRLDTHLEDSARTLGVGRFRIFYRVTLPQLRPAFAAGGLVVALHVLGDFGVVSLMRYDTFSLAIYQQYHNSFDRTYVSWLAILVIAITAGVLLIEARVLRGLVLHRAGSGGGGGRDRLGEAGSAESAAGTRWPLWTVAVAWAGLLLVAAVSAIGPLLVVGAWAVRGERLAGDSGLAAIAAWEWVEVAESAWNSLRTSTPAALLSAVLAVPIVLRSVRHPTSATRIIERLAYFGYATPPLALGLAFIFFTLRGLPFWMYQSVTLLVFALSVHLMAEAIGPIRAAVYHAPPRLEETARTLGLSPFAAFRRVTLPMIRPGVAAGVALVFLSAMKELPLTLMLAPPGFQTLATRAWGRAHESLYADAAPYALVLCGVSCGLVAVVLRKRGH